MRRRDRLRLTRPPRKPPPDPDGRAGLVRHARTVAKLGLFWLLHALINGR
jgi:hypothetical protein